MKLVQGKIYLDEKHIDVLKSEEELVRKRYAAVARALLSEPFHMVYKDAARMIKVSVRHFYRIVKRFREEGIEGLRLKSTRPKTSPNKTPSDIERQIVAVRRETGFGPKPISDIVNESLKREGRKRRVYPSLTYNILVRTGEIQRERQLQKEWRRFEWGHPNRLIQADLTKLNGVDILTMEDDHSRKGWALAIPDAKTTTVIEGMESLIRIRYDNLLTDNGSQFSRVNAKMRKYCEKWLNEKHIWSSIHHPQTLGKLSAFQKGLKRFLRHRLGKKRAISKINYWIDVYTHWYNNGSYHSSIETYPECRYSGERQQNWYEKIVTALKLDGVLTVRS